MTVRKYSSRAQQTTLASAITDTATSMTVVSGSAVMGGKTLTGTETYTVVIDPDTSLEEIVNVKLYSSGNSLTIERAQDGSSAVAHAAGAVVRHMVIGRDLQEANTHQELTSAVHGITGEVVGTTDGQTLSNKILTSPTITNPTITGGFMNDSSIVFEGSTADASETTFLVTNPTTDRTITFPDASGNIVLDTLSQTLSNKTLTSPIISGSPVITGLSSAGMVASSAAPKDYVDSILGSATAASTSAASAATSAASAATSASSAATSASNALTSANSASTSATAAATSAASAATSATAAATSATSAAASATAASTSASSAATSASSASTSASSALTSANSASTSASSALTSANSAATSASTMAASVAAAQTSAASAATSASSAATSASSAQTSASNAATSASNALTSANSAATSATAAATSATSAAASATAAATSATSAAASATAAATSATSAAASATAAATSATSAAASATSAEAAWDSFDDRYLGPKSTPPTVDNDGNPLTAGVIYYNTGDGNMYVWSGSAWVVFTSTGDITAVTVSSPITGGGASGSVNIAIQAATTAQSGAVQLTDSTASTSVTTAATPNSVKSAYDLANAAVPKSDYTAKGVILVGTGTGTYTAQTVGTNGQYLQADSTQADGVKWATVQAGSQVKINGGAASTYDFIDFVGMGTSTATTGTVQVSPANVTDGKAGKNIFVGTTTPTSPTNGDIWIDESVDGDPDLRTMTIMGAY